MAFPERVTIGVPVKTSSGMMLVPVDLPRNPRSIFIDYAVDQVGNKAVEKYAKNQKDSEIFLNQLASSWDLEDLKFTSEVKSILKMKAMGSGMINEQEYFHLKYGKKEAFDATKLNESDRLLIDNPGRILSYTEYLQFVKDNKDEEADDIFISIDDKTAQTLINHGLKKLCIQGYDKGGIFNYNMSPSTKKIREFLYQVMKSRVHEPKDEYDYMVNNMMSMLVSQIEKDVPGSAGVKALWYIVYCAIASESSDLKANPRDFEVWYTNQIAKAEDRIVIPGLKIIEYVTYNEKEGKVEAAGKNLFLSNGSDTITIRKGDEYCKISMDSLFILYMYQYGLLNQKEVEDLMPKVACHGQPNINVVQTLIALNAITFQSLTPGNCQHALRF